MPSRDRPLQLPSARAVLTRLRPAAEDRPAFVEGLLLGAMVGAAIAGSTLWARLREARSATEQPGSEGCGSEPHNTSIG